MSRSRKKSPFIDFAVNNRGNKANKRMCNQKRRSSDNKKMKDLARNYDPDADYDDFMMDEREAMDAYKFNGDGKVYLTRQEIEETNGKYLRK